MANSIHYYYCIIPALHNFGSYSYPGNGISSVDWQRQPESTNIGCAVQSVGRSTDAPLELAAAGRRCRAFDSCLPNFQREGVNAQQPGGTVTEWDLQAPMRMHVQALHFEAAMPSAGRHTTATTTWAPTVNKPLSHANASTDTDEQGMILDSIEKWLRSEVEPRAMQMEHADEYPHDMVAQMREFGLFGATISPEWGGLGLGAVTYCKIAALIAEYWMSLAGIFNSHLMMAAIVEKYGTREQRDYWLPKFATGELRGGLALTEPNAGTDLQGIRTKATADGLGHYVIDGGKTWITNGVEGDVVALLVKTDPGAVPPRKGMSMFIAPKVDPGSGVAYPGFQVGRRLEKLGYKGIDSAELIFTGYRLDSRRHLVGGVEGKGFYMAVGGLELGRINVAARSVGIAKRALREALSYAQDRQTFGKPIAQHQAIQLKLGEMGTRARAAELLTLDAAQAYEAGQRCDLEAGMAKYFASEAALENALEAMRVHGGYGYSKEYQVERLYRDAPLLCIGEGTNEMQRIIIARQLIERNPN